MENRQANNHQRIYRKKLNEARERDKPKRWSKEIKEVAEHGGLAFSGMKKMDDLKVTVYGERSHDVTITNL